MRMIFLIYIKCHVTHKLNEKKSYLDFALESIYYPMLWQKFDFLAPYLFITVPSS